ncbi:ABC transporter permease [Streptomyces sp. NPDC005648]|uniref:ABC transporter permease n=1 Tax=Streptomyces sp. NPDC005648 TaxID=3157044 RepID=UPI0033B65154
MTAAATTARPARVPSPRLTRWLLRLHRPALYVWIALVVVLSAALLWLRGPVTDTAAEAWRHYDACNGDGPRTCAVDQSPISRYKELYGYTTTAVFLMPFLAAAWAGASLIGRELESRTAQLAWTQGVSPARWLAAKLAVPAVPLAAGSALLVLLHHLAWSAGEGRIDTAKTWYDTTTFAVNGPALVALTLAAPAVGALAALVLRNALAALAAALVGMAALWTAALGALPHLWPSVTRTSALADGPLGVGIEVRHGLVTSTGAHVPAPGCPNDNYRACYRSSDAVGFYKDYHPRSHFWPLHLMESGLVLAVAALLALAAFRLLARRTGTARTVRRTGTAREGRAV